MKRKLTWAPSAKDDLAGIKAYIARNAPRVATAFVRRIRERCRSLMDMPFAAPIVAEYQDENIRETYLGSYRIIYEVQASRVVVLRIIHGARLLGEMILEPPDE